MFCKVSLPQHSLIPAPIAGQVVYQTDYNASCLPFKTDSYLQLTVSRKLSTYSLFENIFMDFLYDFSSAKVTATALSAKYKKSNGRNKMWAAVQRDVRQRQKVGGQGEATTYVMYVDRDRGAGVTMGASDLNSDLKKKRKEETYGNSQDTLDWRIFYKEGLANVAHGKFERALPNFDKEKFQTLNIVDNLFVLKFNIYI